VIVPAFMVVAWAAIGTSFTGVMSAAIVGAFWMAVAGTFFAVGNTTAAWLMSVFAAGGLLVAAASARRRRGAALVGAPVGAAMGVAFLICTWAPPASTRGTYAPALSREEAPAGSAYLIFVLTGRP
jgi:hypothetical protein